MYIVILFILLLILSFALIGMGEAHFGVSRLLEDMEKERKEMRAIKRL